VFVLTWGCDGAATGQGVAVARRRDSGQASVQRLIRTATVFLVVAAALMAPATASALGDITPPTSNASPPSFASGPTFEIPYTATDETDGSGLARVDLYAKAPGDPAFPLTPVASDTTPDTPSFTYTPSAGDGEYDFYTVAVDNDGNSELAPLFPDGTTMVDATAPSSSASAPATAASGPTAITYTADDGSGTGVASVELWAKAPGDSGYSVAGTDTTPDTPSFSFDPAGGDGTYSFYTVAVDALGNREAAPATPDAQTVLDATAPSSSATAPGTSGGGPIAITYTADDGSGTGVADVELWAKAPGDSGYSLAGTDTTPDTPSFSFDPAGGDGGYSFYTVATDALGNREAAPATPDAQTVLDTTAPGSSASAPATAASGPIAITYSADDGSGTGVASVELWAKAPGDSSYSLAGTDGSPASPSFTYTPTAGDGTYSFYTVAVDALGNREAAPATPDGQTALDTTAPGSTASAPATSGTGSIPITYTANDGSGTGVASVELWAKAPGDTSYSLAGTDGSPASPSFTYTPTGGDGTYSFYTVATDGLGNREAAPATPDAQTTVDATAPSSSASAPATAASGPIAITYSANDGSGTGVAGVELWAKAPGDSDYSLAGTDSSPTSPSFTYTPTGGDGTYSFYTVAVDALGNREAAPATPDAQTARDTVAPSSSASAPATSGTGSIPITYTAGDGTGTGVASVELWAQPPGYTSFTKVASDSTPASPSFDYTPSAGDGTYFFYTVAIDEAGNREETPATADTRTQRSTAAVAQPAPSSTTSTASPTSDVVAQLPAQDQGSSAPSSSSSAAAPSLPLVAAVALDGKQKLRAVATTGLRFRVYAYRPVSLSITATLTKRAAKRLGLGRHPVIARRTFSFTKPAVYQVTLRLTPRAAKRFRTANVASLVLQTRLSAGSGSSTASSPLTLRR
jgi:hypothetical protein